MGSTFRIPGTSGPDIEVHRSLLGNIKVVVNGVPLKSTSRRRLAYTIPLEDGSTAELQLNGQWRGLRAVVNGAEIPLERQVSWWETGLMFLPMVLVVVGGLIGGLFAIGGSAINVRLARLQIPAPVRAASMVGVAALSAALYLGAALAIAPVASLTTGVCLNGVREGATVTAASSRAVDCAQPHDNEVVGTARYSPDGAYPGDAALIAFGQKPCFDAFLAYVGTDYQTSVLDMTLVTPSDLTWVKGDRTIACVVSAPGGGRLTGSVRGTAR